MALAPGSRLGPYEIVGPLGAGGMGEVYRARDPRLGREVAIKTIHETRAGDRDARLRFTRETRAVAALSHPNVLAIHDVGEDGDVAFAVMELLEGETLRDRLDRGPLPPREATATFAAIAEGMAAAHARGIVHRDLKPANVFITADGQVKILDFGLARDSLLAAGSDPDAATLSHRTTPGTLMGTVDYMSPEQVRGSVADPRSDVFAIGGVLYEALAGRRPFGRPTVGETLAAILKEDAPPLPADTPPALARLVGRCLEKDPAKRSLSARDLAAELRGNLSSPETEERIDSLAVLPFADLSSARDQEYFCDGLADELIDALSRVRGLRVASRMSSFQFKGTATDVRELGRRLGVRAVLEGSVRKAGDRLRVTVQVTDVAQGFNLSSQRYDRALADVFEIQEDLAGKVVAALRVTLSEGEKRVFEPPTTDLRAYDYYLRARGLFHQFRVESHMAARELFLRALEIDPTFAFAHTGLASTCAWLYQWRGRHAEHLEEALAASARALVLRPDLADAHVSRGYALSLAGQAAEAEREFRTAIELDKRLFEAHYFYARTCLEQGRLEDAARLFAEAAETRPEDYQSRVLLALALRGLGEPERAERAGREGLEVASRHLERNPEDVRAVYMIGIELARLQEPARSVEYLERALALDPEDAGTLYNVACGYALLGRTDDALDVLEKAIAKGSANRAWIVNDPDWEGVRGHPRFRALVEPLP
jgi:serine/threonine protein kinase/tetratricopeptide (TPR) repeat protein